MFDSSALEKIQSRILTEPNPFEDRAVGDPWDRAPITDVSSINRGASDTVFRLLEGVRYDRQTRIVLLLGETGAGKSHLIHRILRQLGDRGLFVHVEPFGEASLVCKHILREIAVSLGRRRHPRAAPQIVEFAASVIRDTWRHLLVERGFDQKPKGREQLEKLGGPLDYVFNSFRREDRFKPIYEALLTHLCDEAPDLDRQFLKTFFRVLLDEDRATVLDWLKGKDLEDADLTRIGAPRGLLSEDEAFNAIRALAILSRFYRPLIICFDQNESLLWGDDDSRFQALVTTLCRVHDFTPNCLLLFTCLKQVWVHDYTRRLQKPEIARFESRPVHLDGLTTESAAELVAARMGRVFGDLEPPYPTYPFRPEFFEEFAVLGLPMARELINLCLDRIEDLRTFGRVLEITSPIQSTSTSSRLGDSGPWPWQEHLGKLWDSTLADLERLRQQRTEEQDEIVLEGDFPLDFDEGTLRWTLGRCFRRFQEHDDTIGGCRITRVEERQAQDHKVDFVLTVEHKHGSDRVAIVVNNTRNGNRFSSHLQSGLEYLQQDGAQRFFLIRNEPESEGWRRGRKLLERVLAFGGRREPLDSASLVEILTFYRLCNQASAGDLVADGKAIPRELVEQFVLDTGRLAAVPLFEKIFREVVRLARQAAYDREMKSFDHEDVELVEHPESRADGIAAESVAVAATESESDAEPLATATGATERSAPEPNDHAERNESERGSSASSGIQGEAGVDAMGGASASGSDAPPETEEALPGGGSKQETEALASAGAEVSSSETSPEATADTTDASEPEMGVSAAAIGPKDVEALTLPDPPEEASSLEAAPDTEEVASDSAAEPSGEVSAEAAEVEESEPVDEPEAEVERRAETASAERGASGLDAASEAVEEPASDLPAERASEHVVEDDDRAFEPRISETEASGDSGSAPVSPDHVVSGGLRSASATTAGSGGGALIAVSELQKLETLVRLPAESAAHRVAVAECETEPKTRAEVDVPESKTTVDEEAVKGSEETSSSEIVSKPIEASADREWTEAEADDSETEVDALDEFEIIEPGDRQIGQR